jgi:hypothetical protein
VCRFAALKELLPMNVNVDKATFLMSVVDYVKQLQVGSLPKARRIRYCINIVASNMVSYVFNLGAWQCCSLLA